MKRSYPNRGELFDSLLSLKQEAKGCYFLNREAFFLGKHIQGLVFVSGDRLRLPLYSDFDGEAEWRPRMLKKLQESKKRFSEPYDHAIIFKKEHFVDLSAYKIRKRKKMYVVLSFVEDEMESQVYNEDDVLLEKKKCKLKQSLETPVLMRFNADTLFKILFDVLLNYDRIGLKFNCCSEKKEVLFFTVGRRSKQFWACTKK